MNKKLLIGIFSFIGIAMAVLNPLMIGILAVGIWIYLVRMLQKQNNIAFKDQMETKISEWFLKRLKVFLIVGAFSFLVFIIGGILHNISFDLFEIDETVSFYIALVSLLIFVLATAGTLVVFLKGRQKTIKRID